jgi:hypothetical protein
MAKQTTTLKEKTMALKPRLFRANFPAALLRSTALAVAFLVQVSPARSEVLDLYCKNESNEPAMTLLIDTDARTVTTTRYGNTSTVNPNAFASHKVIVSREFIKWYTPTDCGIGFNPCREEGVLDRIGGTVSVTATDKFGDRAGGYAGSCRRATQKF